MFGFTSLPRCFTFGGVKGVSSWYNAIIVYPYVLCTDSRGGFKFIRRNRTFVCEWFV